MEYLRSRVFARFKPKLDFHDFVIALWDFCTLDTAGISTSPRVDVLFICSNMPIEFFVFCIYKTVPSSITLTTADGLDFLREAHGDNFRKDETLDRSETLPATLSMIWFLIEPILSDRAKPFI